MVIKVSMDLVKLNRDLRKITDRYPRAVASGINRAAQSGYTAAVREVQANTGATSQKTIRRNLTVNKATAEKLAAEIVAKSSRNERIPLFELKPRPRSRTRRRPAIGITYGPASKTIPGSFIATMRAGRSLHTGVFKRLGRPGTGNPKYRRLRAGVVQLNPRLTSSMRDEQVAELFGPSVALVFSRRRVKDKIRSFVRERLTIEIHRALKFFQG